jgi:peptidoglycan hydrolase-like protein with peptidoglycan-binding domain
MSSEKLNVGDFGDDVTHLHENLKKHGFDVSAEEVKRKFFGPTTREAVGEFQKVHGIDPSCEVCMATAARLEAQPIATAVASSSTISPTTAATPLDTSAAAIAGMGAVANPPFSTVVVPGITGGPSAGPAANQHRVEGQIVLDHGLPAGGVTLRVYNRGYGGTETPLGEIKTDAQGGYSLSYDPGGKGANIEVRAVDAQGKEIPLSDTKVNAEKNEVLNLVAPASVQPLAPEFQRLSADLIQQVGDLKKLADAQEHDERQDLTLLHQATGWDARAIALTTTAVKLGTESGIPQDALYALFRAGLPTDKQQLAWVSSQAVEKALGKAKEAGIVSLDDQQIAAAKAAHGSFARPVRLATKAPGALSSIGDMFAKMELGDDKNKFVDLYFEHRGTARELWEKARTANISEASISKLKFQGKLAYLTLNNADLAVSLQQEIGSLDNLSKLVEADLYQADAWKTRVNQMAGNDEALTKLIPPAYLSDKTDAKENLNDRLDAYSEDLARKVRLSYPTQVVRRMIENGPEKGGLSLGKNHEAIKTPVHTFLKNAEGLGFELGQTPADAFIKQNQDKLFQGIAEDQIVDTTKNVKTLQRLYQTSPSDQALKVLFNEGFKSAQDIVAFPYETFQDRYGHLFPSREEARVVYRKAEQVSVVTYNFFTIAKQLDSAPPVAAISPPAHVRENAKNELIKHYPTMESLFGSLDFCECEHCRSVLSPAAYFVDLLQFLDPGDLVWSNFLDDWIKKHNGKAYDGPGYQYKKPYEALIERRPDLPHLQLTCENTHTALPYIDVVNEILEYFVAKDKLTEEAAHDTGDASTAELLAEPQNIIPKAYETLNAARYPLTLPFDLWLETVRQFFDHFETPLWQVLETFRPSDELFAPAADPISYSRADIFSEYLGLSPAEYGIFTDPNPLARWFELYGYTSEADALVALKSAKTLSRRLGVRYKELTNIIQTSFVNPELYNLSIVWTLQLGVGNVVRYFKDKDKPEYAEEKKAFEARLEALLQETSSEPKLDDILAKLNELKARFQQALVLRDTSALCNFDETYLEYADPADPSKPYADALVFLKINLFVRLWKKLGWTMEETDRAVQTFLPKNSLPLTGTNIGAALKTTLVYLAHLKNLDERVKVGKNGRLKLLTLWSNLSTTGKSPLYSQLFLTRSVLKNDPVFDDPLGNYLSKAGIFVKDHLLTLRSALNLTMEEIDRIIADSGKNLDTTELSLDTVSLLYRHGLLAKALKLSVRDLITLKRLSGLDPFKPLSDDPLTKLDDDHPFKQTLRFIEVAEIVKESGFTIEDIDYLLRHRFDPVGKYRSGAEVPLALMKSLAAEIRRIQAEHAIPEDPATLSDEVLRKNLALALTSEVAETFFAMWAGTKEYEVAYPDPISTANKLNPETFSKEPTIRVSYDAVRQKQRLSFKGVLLDTQKAQLKSDFPSPIVATLLDTVQKQAKDFFNKHLEKSTVGAQPAGFLEAGDFELLFAPVPNGLTDTQKQAETRKKRETLAKAFLPFLQQKLVLQLIVQTLAANLTADPVLTEGLLTEASLLSDPGQPGKPFLDAFASAGEQGISLAFFASPDGTGDPLPPGIRTVMSVDTALKDEKKQPIRPNNAQSARFEGYFEVPTGGAYRFFMVFGKKDAEAELHLNTPPETVIHHKAGNDNHEISDPSDFVELKPGVPYRFMLNARNLGGGDIALLIQGESLPKDSFTQLTLYPHATVEHIQRIRILLAKVLQLILGFGISEREVRYLLTHAADFDNLDLGKLPVSEINDATVLFQRFLRLANYALLKRDLASNTDDLVGVFETKKLDEIHKRIGDLTRRDPNTIQATVKALALNITDFANEQGLQRLWEGLQLIEKLGVPAEAVARWTNIVKSPKTLAEEKQRIDIARDLKNTVKARYEPENWQRIAQPIFDNLRQRQRDALVAYILHRHGFERIEQLFEYFLIDPGMEPVVQTSRIRLAISSIQIFIQRCLLNLEPKVHPSVINSKQWQWMKRYRVWEANRKIFLFPENWLEPEFRDDKTNLFQELEGALLQGDVSNDLAEDAFFQYLKKLKELAKLDIVTMYCEEKPDPPSLNALHVIGRTSNTPHKYFYRRYAHQMWTPWEPVTAEIDGDHIVALVWRERLHLFWVTFMVKAQQGSNTQAQVPENASVGTIFNKVAQITPQLEVQVQLHWSEYFQGQWSTRESSAFGNPLSVPVGNTFDSRKVFIHVTKEYDNEEESAVNINLLSELAGTFRVVSKNSPPEPKPNNDSWWGSLFTALAIISPYLSDSPSLRATYVTGSGPLRVIFREKITTIDGKPPEESSADKLILRQGHNFSLLRCSNLIDYYPDEFKPIVSPIFYQDGLHTFFVEPSLTKTTIDRWEEWIITTPPPVFELDDDWWKSILIVPIVPIPKQPVPITPIDPHARFGIQLKGDWLTNPATVLEFGDRVVGQVGGFNPALVTGGIALSDFGVSSSVNPGGTLTPSSVTVAPGMSGLTAGAVAHGGLNVIGGSGLSSVMVSNIGALTGSGLGQNVSDIGAVRGILNR